MNHCTLTCVDQWNQQKRVEEEVDRHHTVDLHQSCFESSSVFLDCSIINIPVSVRERNVGVLNRVENHVQNIRFSYVPGCEKFSDEDSRDVEEKDDPEDKESFV